MELKLLFVFFLSYISTIKSSQDEEIPASVRRALILDILYNLNILHDAPIRNTQFVGRKLNEARTDLSIQRAILDHSKPVQNIVPRYEKLVAPSPSDHQTNKPPESQLNEFNLPTQRIQTPSFLQPERKPPLAVGNPNIFVSRPDSIWAYMNLDNRKSTPEIQTTAPPSSRTFQVSINSPSVVAPASPEPTIGTSDTTGTTESPMFMDPLANLFSNLLQNPNPTFNLDIDTTPLTPSTVDTAPQTINSTTDTSTSRAPFKDPFAHFVSNLLKIPGAFTNPMPGSPNLETPSTLVDHVMNNSDPMANLFTTLLDQSPTPFEVTNLEPVSATTSNPLPSSILSNTASPMTDSIAFGILPAEQVPHRSQTTLSPLLDNIMPATASQFPREPTAVNQDTILNAFIPPPPVIKATTPSTNIYQNNLPTWHQSGLNSTNTTLTGQINPQRVSTNSDIAFQNLPPTQTNFQNVLLSGQNIVHSTSNDAVGQMNPNGVPIGDTTATQTPLSNGHQKPADVTNDLIRMLSGSLPEPLSEDKELSDLEKLLAPPTIFALGSDAGTPPGASVVDSQRPNPSPTVLPKPGNTFATNEQTVSPIVIKPATTFHPLISSIIRQNAGTNQPSAVMDKPTTPSTITPVRRPNPFFNARPVYPQARYPPTQTPSQPSQYRPVYYFDHVTGQYRLTNQRVPPNPARPQPSTYPQPPTSNQNLQQPPTQNQGSLTNRYPLPGGQQPTQNRYPNVNSPQQVPAGYRPPGYYYPNYPYATRNAQTTEAPEPLEPPEQVEPREPQEPVEPQEAEEQEEPISPNWYIGAAGSSSSSSEGD